MLYTDLVDILAVSRLIKGTIYREKTKIINPWGVRRPPPPKNDAPDINTLAKQFISLSLKTTVELYVGLHRSL